VVVSAADVERLGGDGSVVKRPDLEPGHVGILQQTADGACAFLGPDGCSVYDRRPEVCRTFGATTCDRYAPDARKQLGLVRLRVLQGT
jgi:Fe-S-cluster containining protein